MRRDRVSFGAVTLLLAVALGAPPADAGSISLTMTPTATLADGILTVRLSVVNKGDEAAQSVVPTLVFQGRNVRGQGRSSLGPNETLEEPLTVAAGELGGGRFLYRVMIDYTDANQYAFQAVHESTIEVGSPPPPPAKVVVLDITAPGLSTQGGFSVKVKNLTGTARNASVRK